MSVAIFLCLLNLMHQTVAHPKVRLPWINHDRQLRRSEHEQLSESIPFDKFEAPSFRFQQCEALRGRVDAKVTQPLRGRELERRTGLSGFRFFRMSCRSELRMLDTRSRPAEPFGL